MDGFFLECGGGGDISAALTVMWACVLMLSVYIGAWTIQNVPTKTDCLGTCPQQERTVLGLALASNHIPHLTMHSTASFPKPRRPCRWTRRARGPLVAVKKEEALFFFFPFAEMTAKFSAAETRSFGRVNTPVCQVSDDAAGSWCYRIRRVRGQTWSHWVHVQEERGRRWIQFRANGSVQLPAHLWGEWGPCVWRRKGPDLKSVLCVRWAECVTEGTIPECGDWGSLELAGLLWLLKTFTTMATGGSLCSWVKGQLEEFSLGSNRKAFVAPGTQDWLQLVPCEIACTAQDT